MDLKPKLTSHQILAKKFTPDVKGYQPEEVDRFLDEILDDYHVLEAFLKNEYQTLAALQEQNQLFKQRCQEFEVTIALLQDKVRTYESKQTLPSENLELIRRISALEKALWQKGVDPTKIKS